jgi:hypothetical protein
MTRLGRRAVLAALALPGIARAQRWAPTQAIRLVTPYGPAAAPIPPHGCWLGR